MTRLLALVEGHTEVGFVEELLRPHLLMHGYSSVAARLLGDARPRRQRGGIRPWHSVRRDIVRHLREDSGLLVTTMLDFYGLPSAGDGAWPGRDAAHSVGTHRKGVVVCAALAADVADALATDSLSRFIPFVAVHEFEGLLFADCAALARAVYRDDKAAELLAIRAAYGSPEDINDHPATAPSKRLAALLPEYDKIVAGVLAAQEIGLPKIRRECPTFDRWLGELEQRGKPAAK